jgi:dihydropteroate synthase
MTQNTNNFSFLNYTKPLIMGILNITPDSFYNGSRVPQKENLLLLAQKMITDGAAILDLGGQSTRPSSTLLSPQEEIDRVIPAIEAVYEAFPNTPISVDTFYSQVAEAAVKAGAKIVNDISGGQMDNAMIPTVAKLQVPYICMHTRGTPQNMMQKIDYENVLQSLHDYFTQKIDECTQAGVAHLILDIGFGFAKTPTQNLLLLKKMKTFTTLGYPLLAGVSRKSTIYSLLNTDAAGALNGTTVLNTIALQNGANILRVHDVKEAIECVTLVGAYESAVN